MSTPPQRMASIRDRLASGPENRTGHLTGATASVALSALRTGTSLGGLTPQLAGRSVLVQTRDQLAAALALIELDGIARRVIVSTPDLAAGHLPGVVARADVDAVVSDGDSPRELSHIPL